jgi:hypothetical protein
VTPCAAAWVAALTELRVRKQCFQDDAVGFDRV